MRLWSIHPRYLDPQGLVALWREALLAQKVLAGGTKGYRHHPQLIRFQKTKNPLRAIGCYLDAVAEEALSREYNFNRSKILEPPGRPLLLTVTRGQLRYEFEHLLRKLKKRNPPLFEKWAHHKALRPHPLFRPITGKVQSWEK
jgi:hypothetical protein